MTSQFKGVCWRARHNAFETRIAYSGKMHHIGCYKQEQQAAKARDKALFVLHRAGEMQIGLTSEEKQQLQGVSIEELLSAFRAESARFSMGSSAYRGVSYYKRTHKYRAHFKAVGGKNVHLGYFVCEEDAAHAYDAAIRQFHGSKALVNFPDAEDLTAPTAGPPTGATLLGRNNQASAAADDDMQAMQAVVNTEASGNVPKLDEGQTIALLQPAMHDGDAQANRPAEKPLASNSLSATAPAARTAAANTPTPASISSRRPGTDQPAPSSSAVPLVKALVSAQAFAAQTAHDLGTASGSAAASGLPASGLLGIPLPEQCNFGQEEEEGQEEEDAEDEEDSDDELFSDDALSGWGSDEEIWGTDSDYYDTDEEEAALADLYNHPDYKYLVRHNGEPNLSLFGGPDADITPANLLKKLMLKWGEEAEQSSECTASGTSASCAVMPERWEEGVSSGGGGVLSTPPASLLGHQPAAGLLSPRSISSARALKGSAIATSAEGRRAAGWSRRKKRSLKPSVQAVAMANSGCRAVPGMSPAEYREAVYATYMTNQPWGMKLMKCDSDEDDSNMTEDEDEPPVLRPGRDRLPEDDTDSEHDEEERAQKRSKLTEATQALGEQVAAVQKRMGMTDNIDITSAQTDKPGSMPWWAQEMGMTEEEYWNGLQSNAGGSGADMPQESARKEDLDFLASFGPAKRRSVLYL